MSFLSQLPQDRYPADAFSSFISQAGFSLGNATAMAWMAQLSYETPCPKKIMAVLRNWGLPSATIFARTFSSLLPMTSARGIIATGHNAMVVAFTGTEPLSVHDWITDFDVGLSFDDIQHAYQSAVDAAWTDIGPAIADNAAQGNLLFVTGHSMGGALAVIAAARAAADPKTEVTAVYTIGGARAGGQAFADAYPLPDATFRLVYGDDMVTALPPLSLGYRHVGRMLYCPRGETFADVNFSPAGGPDGRQLDKTLLTGLGDVIAGQPPTNYPLRSPPIALLFRALPPGIADHVPDTYLRALGQAA
jgi:hypothetical protein